MATADGLEATDNAEDFKQGAKVAEASGVPGKNGGALLKIPLC
jgi:hypothetical protein